MIRFVLSQPFQRGLLLSLSVASVAGCFQDPPTSGPATATPQLPTPTAATTETAGDSTLPGPPTPVPPLPPAARGSPIAVVERRAEAGPTDLESLIDAARDVVRGRVERDERSLRVVGRDALVRIPLQVTGDYVLAARVRRREGEQQIVVIVPVRDRHATVILDWNTHDLHGLETIDGENVGRNGQSRSIPFSTGQWYELTISVRHLRDEVAIAAKLDDQQLFDWRGRAQQLTVWHPWMLTEAGTLGLANWDSGPVMVTEYERLVLTPAGTVAHWGESRGPASPGDTAAAAPPHPSPPAATPRAASAEPVASAAPPGEIVPVSTGNGDWPCFRGPGRQGSSSDRGLPVSWSDDQNVVWRRELPGPGASSPIVWGEHVYITCYSGYGLSKASPGDQANLVRHLVCIDRATGRSLWQADTQNCSPDSAFGGFRALHGYATSTPVADESGVYVFYGSSGAAAYSHGGQLRWQRSLGTGAHDWGTSASPVLFDDLVIYHADIEGQQLVALAKDSGEPAWSVPTGSGDSWSTPCLASVAGRQELIFHHSQADPLATLMAVDPRDGSARWRCRVLKDYLCPSPIVAGDLCFVLGYQRGAAIRLGGAEDVTDSHIAWTTTKGSEVCTPVYHDGHLYWAHQENGIAYCLNASTGDVLYEERLDPRPGRIYASGVVADGKIYYVSRENGTYVVAAAPRFRLLAHNRLASDTSVFNATPAITGGQLLLRSNKALYCIRAR